MLMKSITRHQTRTKMKAAHDSIPMEVLKQQILKKTNAAIAVLSSENKSEKEE